MIKIAALTAVLGLWTACSSDDQQATDPISATDMQTPMVPTATPETIQVPSIESAATSIAEAAAAAAQAQAEADQEANGTTRWVTASALNVRNDHSMNGQVIRHVHRGERVQIHETHGVWGRIGPNEWASTRYMRTHP